MHKHFNIQLLLLICLGLWIPATARALETDQFTLPPKPLADIGPEVDEYVRQLLGQALEKVNQQIQALQKEQAQASSDQSRQELSKQIDTLHHPLAIATEFRKLCAREMPESEIEKWLRKNAFKAQPARFDPRYRDTVFGGALFVKPLLVTAIAPTVKIHGVMQGTDKLGHFVQQGQEYLQRYVQALQQGQTKEQAIKAGVDYGIDMEKTWGGQWWTGAYSNGDLAANFAGFWFFLNLGQAVKVGDRELPPVYVIKDGLWTANPNVPAITLAPFISEHFDEAMNPSWYDAPMRPFIRAGIQAVAPAWVQAHQATRDSETKRLKELSTWYGQDYGYCPDELITIINAYFDQQASSKNARK